MKNQKNHHKISYFKHWTRNSFAVFNSLKRNIKICSLTLAGSLLMKPALAQQSHDSTAISKIFEMDAVVITAQRTPVESIKSARVVSVISREEILKSTATDIAGLLENVAGVDIRQRGSGGMQADISIRGGSFEQVLILINGVNMNDPQTGHHHMNLPISTEWIERIEILKGPAARVFGPNAFNGVINIVTIQNRENSFGAGTTAGSFTSINTDASIHLISNKIQSFAGINYSGSEGYTNNTDYRNSNAFAVLKYEHSVFDVHLQGGTGKKAFGANSFYTPKFPEQYEETDVKFASLSIQSHTQIKITPVLSIRDNTDEFRLFRNAAPTWYKNHNFHNSKTLDFSIPLSYRWAAGTTSIGYNYRTEKIASNVLGDKIPLPEYISGSDSAFYTHKKSREIQNFYGEHSFKYGPWNVVGGVLLSNNSFNNQWGFYPSLDIRFQINQCVSVFANYSQSLRIPSFTDLYYQSASISGNTSLLPEEANWVEFGVKYNEQQISGYASLFYRQGKNMIDWVKLPDAEIWSARNHTEVNIGGVEMGIHFKPAFLHKSGISYTYLLSDKNSGELLSKYVMDHLRHKLDIQSGNAIWRDLSLNWNISIQQREGKFQAFEKGNYLEESKYPVFVIANTNVSWTTENYSIFLKINNLLNQKWFDHSNIPEPGISFMGGFRVFGLL